MIRASFRDPVVRGQQIESKTGMALVRQARDSQQERRAPLADVLVHAHGRLARRLRDREHLAPSTSARMR